MDRLARLIQADPSKARLDRLITRWLKRHLRRLGAEIDLNQIHSLVEDKAMLAENLESWAQREREEGRQEAARSTARQLIELGLLTDGQIAQVTGLSVAQVEAQRAGDWR